MSLFLSINYLLGAFLIFNLIKIMFTKKAINIDIGMLVIKDIDLSNSKFLYVFFIIIHLIGLFAIISLIYNLQFS